MHLEEIEWIDERGFPGGPLAHLFELGSSPLNVAGDALSHLVPVVADSLLVSGRNSNVKRSKGLIHGSRSIGYISSGVDGTWLSYPVLRL